jgi:glucosamine--fructose-6-phosphate aminotransferase (isomerizing)
LRGTYGLVILFREHPNLIVAARQGSPLVVGVGHGEHFIASDASPLAGRTDKIVYLADRQIALITADTLEVSHCEHGRIEHLVQELEIEETDVDLGGFPHYMLKEIFEQPESLRNAMRGRVNLQTGEITLGGLKVCERELPRAHRALLFGCGTAWHAALVGRYLFEDLARLPTNVDYASELRYRNPIVEQGTLAIAVSQSGETADTLAALREVRTKGAMALGVVNGVGSSIARETEAGIYLHVGPEIGVASTKAFTAQVAVLTMLALYLGRRRHLSTERTEHVLGELDQIPDKVKQALELSDQVKALAERLAEWENWLYLGHGVNYPLALEGALKLKEISYIHAEGLPAADN